jgi:allantoin racemase
MPGAGLLRSGQHAELPILNPNLMALKAAESLADLFVRGRYTISRRGFYQRHDQHDAAEAADVSARFRLIDLAAHGGEPR